jgi:hypothetical protein
VRKNYNAVSAVKAKASVLAEQSSAIVDMAADFKPTLQSRKLYLEAKMVRMRLANLKELRYFGLLMVKSLKKREM